MHPQGLIGLAALVAIAFALSTDRTRIPWRLVAAGLALQLVLAPLLLIVPGTSDAFALIARFVAGVIDRTQAGISFVFGPALADPAAGPWGFVFALHVLPVIIFFASLMAVLYHLGLIQLIIRALAALLRSTLRVTGAEALAMAANVFVGQTEAPLTVKPLIPKMTTAQLMTLMTGGFATIAGSVLAGYVLFLGADDPADRALFTKHLLTASVLSAPAAFVFARLIIPESQTPPADDARLSWDDGDQHPTNILDAAAAGATQGLKLALNVAAMLIAFLALLALVNWPLETLSQWGPVADFRDTRSLPPFTLEYLLGLALAPLAWTLGVAWSDAPLVGSLLGQKIFLTEFVAYANLGELSHSAIDPDTGAEIPPALSARSAQIAAYALCGFANVGSIAIQIGGLSAIAPARRHDFARLAPRAMIAGALASFTTAATASLFIS